MAGPPLSIGPPSGLNRSHTSIPHPASTSGSGPTPRRKSHYRPFSSQSSYIDIATAQSSPSLRRSASVGGLHQFCNNMGLQFGSRGRKELGRPNSPAVLPSVPDASLRPTKKRSMASIFTSDPFTAPPSSSPKCSDELPIINISRNHVSYAELDACDKFMPKDIWANRCNMKLHPYHKTVAYMQAYDPISLESDRYTDLLFRRLTNGSPSFHDYGNKPPAMVLDLGCGQGHWILHAANIWKNTEFVGLDIVDITLPTFETSANVRLVRGDFANYKFPFPDDTFDFVRMANLALCIPYDKWEFVLGQVRRVLTPGGRLELIDDDIYFPYGEGSKGVELEALVPASPFFGGERLDVGDNETGRGEDTVDGDSMKPEATNEATGPIPVASDSSSIPDSTSRYERTDLKSTISPRPTPGRRQCSGSKTISRSATRHLVPPSPTMRKDDKLGNSSPPCPKRIKEKVALLPPIRSITPAFSLSSGSKYFPTWSLRTANTSPTSEASSIRSTDTSPSTSVSSVVEPENPMWQKKIVASRNMESLFEKMLVEQYGIHPRPSEFILRVFGKVFHEDGDNEAQVRMTKNFHIKLAPTETINDQPDNSHVGETEKGHGSMEEVEGMASTSTGMSSTFSTFDVNSKPQKQNRIPITSLRSRPWQGQDKRLKVDRPRSKEEKDKDKQNKSKLEEQDGKQFKPKKTQAGTIKTTATMTVSLFKRSQPQDIALCTPVSPALSTKAAGILGIPYSELSTVTLSLKLSSKERRSPVVPLTWSFPSNLSAKAAGRLGITYSEALSAAASLSVPCNAAPVPSSSATFSPTTSSEPEPSSNTTSGPVQHPGLFIWPGAYVPMAPGELEMHACKYIHTLLGCRPALEEFVAKFVDGRGDRLVGEEELRDEIWEYECFRRARFNWPSEVAEPYEDDLANPNVAGPPSPAHCTSNDASTAESVDANQPTSTTLDLPAIDMIGSVPTNGLVESTTTTRTTNGCGGFSIEKVLRPTKSSLLLRSSSPTGNKGYRKLDGFVHLRSIRVFEGIKAA